MKSVAGVLAGAVGLMTVSASGAWAAPLTFTLSGARSAVFQLDSNPIPSSFSSSSLIGDQIFFNGLAGTYGGVAGVADVNFGSGLIASLNISSSQLGFTQFGGPTLFSGSADHPVFSTGTFDLPNPFFGDAVLVISDAVSAAPEPGVWALMLSGIAALGAVLRLTRARRRGIGAGAVQGV